MGTSPSHPARLAVQIAGGWHNLLKLNGEEGLGVPFSFRVTCLLESTQNDLYKSVKLKLAQPDTHLIRTICGVITAIEEHPSDHRGHLLTTLQLEPRMALLRQQANVRVLLDRSLIDVIRDCLIPLGYRKDQLRFHLEGTYPPKPYRLQVPGESDFDFLQRLIHKAGLFYWFSAARGQEVVHFSDNLRFCPYHDDDFIHCPNHHLGPHHIEHAVCTTQSTLHGRTHDHRLFPGQRVCLQADAFSTGVSGNWLIQSIKHKAEQMIKHCGHEVPYYNTLQCHPCHLPFRPPVPTHPNFPGCFTAHIESQSETAQLDDAGAYRLRQHFDLSGRTTAQASPYIPRLLPYGGPSNDSTHSKVGFHAPLRAGAEVLVGALNGDPDCPIILGTVQNSQQRGPVNAQNKTQNRWVSAGDNALLMDDAIDKEAILLRTAGGKNRLSLDAKKGAHALSVASDEGEQHWYAKKDSTLHAGNDLIESIGDNKTQIAEMGYRLETLKKDIHHQSATNYTVSANKGIHLQSQKNTALKSADQIHINAQNDIDIRANGDHTRCHLPHGDLSIQSASGITITGDGAGDITIGRANAGIKLTKNGTVEIYGDTVNLSTPGGVALLGQVTYAPHTGPPAPPPIPPALRPAPIATLAFDRQTLEQIDGQLIIHLYFDLEGKIPVHHDFLKRIKRTLISQPMTTTSHPQQHPSHVKDNQIQLTALDLRRPITLELIDPRGEQVVYVTASNQKPHPPIARLVIPPGQPALKKREIHLTLLRPPILANLRLETVVQAKRLFASIDQPLCETDLALIQHGLRYFRPEPNLDEDPYRRIFLSDEEIHYLKANGSNVTLFIHGYNVPYGRFGKQFAFADNGRTVTGFTDQHAGLYREIRWNQLPRNTERMPNIETQFSANGSGAHAWFTHMSENLNQATKQFDGKDYTKYTHVLGIAWQGNPINAGDYMADVPLAKYPAKLITALIRQLHKAGICVNVIAHSLGNLVLMHCLEQLGKEAPRQIDCALLWEAAIPDTAFSTQTPRAWVDKKYYYFPNAHQGAKRFTVLHSKNDNVIGPINCNNFKELASAFKAKLLDKNAGLAIAAVAVAIHYFDANRPLSIPVKSVYNAANLLGCPLSDLMDNEKARVAYYNKLRDAHPTDLYGQPLQGTLSLQCKRIRSDYFDFYNELSALIRGGSLPPENAGAQDPIRIETYREKIEKQLNKRTLGGERGFSRSILLGVSDEAAEEVATLVISTFISPIIQPRPGMGYAGIDDLSRRLLGDRCAVIDQKEWLTSHSSMRAPSPGLMQHVYQTAVLSKTHGIRQFGRYTT